MLTIRVRCHARKVRCDVEKYHPCTNCAAFGCECKIPLPKRRRASVRRKNSKTDASSTTTTKENALPKVPESDPKLGSTEPAEEPEKPAQTETQTKPAPPTENQPSMNLPTTDPVFLDQTPDSPAPTLHNPKAYTIRDSEIRPLLFNSSTESWIDMINAKDSSVSTGPSAYLGSSSNVNLLLEQPEEGNTFHYTLPEDISSSRLKELNKEEIEILKFRGAFLLPPRDLCDDLIETFFEKIHPTLPYLNRSQFMRRYNDSANPPSLLLIQAMLLSASRVCKNPALLDESGSADLASLTFYKRAKALFDANYESDRMTIVQAVILLGSWWEGPEDVTKNSFYWVRVALSIAQGFGLHRSMDKTNMSLASKRSWKRMWWSLFVRDRWIAVSLGRPMFINLEDSDVPMLTEDDFIEDEPGLPSLYPFNRVHALYFIHTVKLAEIVGLVLRQQFSVNAENSRRQNKVPVVSHCDMAMGSWMNSLPPELKYSVKDKPSHTFLTATLHAQYYTVLCLVHRGNILRKGLLPSNLPYPSWGIAFQAAHMISRIFENLLYYDECRDLGALYNYTLLSAMIMLLYQTESSNPSTSESAKKSLATCLAALEEIGHSWTIGRIILKLFKQLHQNKVLRQNFINRTKKRSNEMFPATDTPVKKSKSKADKNAESDEKSNKSKGDLAESTKKGSSELGVDEAGIPFVRDETGGPGAIDAWSEVKNVDKKKNENKSQQKNEANNNFINPNKVKNLASHSHSLPEDHGTPEFMMIANNDSQAQKFYDNFQLSQLFPETSPEGREVFSDNLFMNLGMDFPGQSNTTPTGSTQLGGGGGVNTSDGEQSSPSQRSDTTPSVQADFDSKGVQQQDWIMGNNDPKYPDASRLGMDLENLSSLFGVMNGNPQ